MHTEGFPGCDIGTSNEIVTLTETSTTLELLFQYIYRQPQPNLEGLDFKDLNSLAEAAEKYQVFSAMEVCRLFMRSVNDITFTKIALRVIIPKT